MKLETELAIIGCMLKEPSLLPDILACLVAEDFSSRAAIKLFEAARDLHDEGCKLDAAVIGGRAGRESRNYALQAIEYPSFGYNLDTYLELAVDDRRRCKAQELLAELQSGLYAGTPTAELQVSAASLAALLTDCSDSREVGARQGRLDFLQRQSTPRQYIQTGYRSLDRGLYIDKGDYIVIGGRPSSGKTAFAINIARNMSKSKKVVFFSLETSKEKIMDRLITAVYGLDYSKVEKHSISDEDMGKVVKDRELVDGLNFHVVEASGRTVPWMQAKAGKLGADVVFLDYIGLIASEGKSRYEKTTNASMALHVFAQRSQTTVIALSQLRRANERRPEAAPTVEDLRESGQIEQDADAIILLHKEDRADRRKIIVAKNKEGITATQDMAFEGNIQQFCELEEFVEYKGSDPWSRKG